jgi:hypothetical protein
MLCFPKLHAEVVVGITVTEISQPHLKSSVTLITLKTTTDIAEWRALVSWVWSIVTELETWEETLFSVALLEAYLDSNDDGHQGSIGDELKQLLHDFLTNNIRSSKQSPIMRLWLKVCQVQPL